MGRPALDVTEEAAAARRAGLRYRPDAAPGITRRRRGRGFGYLLPDGRPLRDPAALDRIRALAVPPAWTDVWISPDPRGHLQATGRDARGRKQYRYHPHWRAVRDETKYEQTLDFGLALPAIRRRVDRDLRSRGLTRTKVVACVVRLLDATSMRVGNEDYARENGSFGLSTLRNRHAEVHGPTIELRFTGKSGKVHRVEVDDPRVARIVKRCQDLPGARLFEFVNGGGDVQPIGSDDVNEYLREITGRGFTAKTFRTWAGTVLAAWELRELGSPAGEAEGKRQVVAAVDSVARELGNTRAVCRRCYIHPEVIDAHMDGTLAAELEGGRGGGRAPRRGLSAHETAVLHLLRHRIAAHARAA
jgi:DNA topoisomerase-1